MAAGAGAGAGPSVVGLLQSCGGRTPLPLAANFKTLSGEVKLQLRSGGRAEAGGFWGLGLVTSNYGHRIPDAGAILVPQPLGRRATDRRAGNGDIIGPNLEK